MNSFNKKVIDAFPGKVVRKDLTAIMKKGANVPTYVLEYLLGMYCSTDDEAIIQAGFEKIKQILTDNYVRPDQSEYIKSKIRENGEYTIIDKVSVCFNEREDCYVASFANLDIASFIISPNLVVHNEKLLLGGIWCLVRIKYESLKNDDEDEEAVEDFFDNKKIKKKKKKKSKYESPFSIVTLKPIQMPTLDIEEFIEARNKFSKDEWIDLLLRSAGYEPTVLSKKQKYHFLLRLVPLIQKNYNLVELGPRGTGKSHVYSELSPYSILMSSGHTSVANLFYNMNRRKVGLVGHWDCIAFDEVSGMNYASGDLLQTLKNYMANGSFARGTESIGADASISLEGNIFRSVHDMLRTTTLFEPFPIDFNNDSAFFDRIHAYLPGWEVPKLKASSITNDYGLISDCLSEFMHTMRKYDFTDKYLDYFTFNNEFNKRDDIAVSKTFSGLAKLIFPSGDIEKEDAREILEYAIEGRRRVKEQLNKMTPSEFKNVNLGYIDNETGDEYIVNLPEQQKETLVFKGLELPGYVYAIGKSSKDLVSVYRLENRTTGGTGKFLDKNIEGIGNHPEVKQSLHAAFNYFSDNISKIVNGSVEDFDYALYYNDLQHKGVSEEVSVAEVIGLCSAFASKPVLPSLVVVGRVVMSGSMMPLSTDLLSILTAAITAGAKQILLPIECKEKFAKVGSDIATAITPLFYATPVEAVQIALGIKNE